MSAPALQPSLIRERGNRLVAALAVLGPSEAEWLTTEIEPVELDLGQLIAESNEPFRHVYFPETAVFSVISRMADGAVEVGTVGNEGMAGVAVFLDTDACVNETVAQIPGSLGLSGSDVEPLPVSDRADEHETLLHDVDQEHALGTHDFLTCLDRA